LVKTENATAGFTPATACQENNIKKILVITSSPRKGNSTHAAEITARAIRGKKTFVDVNRLSMKPCTACGKCGETFMCVYDDDAAGLIRRVDEADVIVVAAPVYFTGVPGPLKIFIDRNQSKWEEFEFGTRNQERGGNKPENGNRKPKTGIIILTAGHNKAKYFKPAESETRSFFAVNRIKTKLVMKLGGMDEKGAAEKYAAKIRAAVKKALKNG
jgi:multimeric flavodoxin WrbA